MGYPKPMLIQGQLVVREPPGTWHGRISANLTLALGSFVKQRRLGAVFAQDTGFKIAADPDTVRGVKCLPRSRNGWGPEPGWYG